LITGAAPIASLILAGGSIALLMLIWPLDHSATSIWHYLLPFLVGWITPCVLFLPGVLLPYRYEYVGRKMETDAMRLLTIPRLSDAEIEKKIRAAQTLLTIRAEIDPRTVSLKQALERANAAPNDQLAISTAAAFLRKSCDPRVLGYYKKLVTLFPKSTKRTQFLDQYLTCSLEMDAVSSNAEEMDQLSRELSAANPESVSVLGTRGSILIDLGRTAEGKAMLNEVLERTDSVFDKVYTFIFLALAEKQEGNLGLAHEYIEKAVKLDPNCPALKWVPYGADDKMRPS
jgi:tetratricopeptide (TPR) repeat protein